MTDSHIPTYNSPLFPPLRLPRLTTFSFPQPAAENVSREYRKIDKFYKPNSDHAFLVPPRAHLHICTEEAPLISYLGSKPP